MWCFHLDTFLRVSWNCYLETRFIEKPPVCNSSFSPSHLTMRTVNVCCTVWRKLPRSETGGKYCSAHHLQEQKSREVQGSLGTIRKDSHPPLSRIRIQEYWGCRDHWLPTQYHEEPPEARGTWALHISAKFSCYPSISTSSLLSLHSLM